MTATETLCHQWRRLVCQDGLTYTYTIHLKMLNGILLGWEFTRLKAQDFVTGLKYAADNKSEALYITVQDSIKGLDACEGEVKRRLFWSWNQGRWWSRQFSLWTNLALNSKTTMGVLAPVNERLPLLQGKWLCQLNWSKQYPLWWSFLVEIIGS